MKKINIVVFILVCLFSSCRKDKLCKICHDLPSSPSATGWEYALPMETNLAPYFNPNNSNEMIYRRINRDANNNYVSEELWKFNLSIKEHSLLIEGVHYRPKWGKSDWLLFNRTDNQVWKMKSNGDSLTLLTDNTTLYTHPEWNSDNTAFVCWTFDNQTLLISHHGVVLDTLATPFYKGAWSPNEKYLAIGTYAGGVDVNNLETGEVIRFQSEFDIFKGNGRGMSWTPDGKYLIWAASEGVFKSDMETFSTVMIKKSCESLGYFSPSVSADYEIIFERRTNSVDEDKNEYYSESQFVITDINGENEREVLLE